MMQDSTDKVLLPKQCLGCGRTFTPGRVNNQRYCSTDCRDSWQDIRERTVKLPKQCPNCGNTFVPTQTNRQRFCNKHCKDTYKNRHREKYACTCLNCGKQFSSVYMTSRYCSERCSLLHVPVPIKMLTCIDCGISFIFKGRTRKHRCDACRRAWLTRISLEREAARNPKMKLGVGSGNNQRGTANHAWNPESPYHGYIAAQGYTEPYRCICWRVWEHQCAIPSCGVTNDETMIDVHHIDGVRSNAHISNLVPLCRKHHSKLHRGDKFKPTCAQDYITRLYSLWPELRSIIECRIKIAELSGDTGTPAIRTEGCSVEQSGATTTGEINQHEAATPGGEKIV